jgi:SAM-dependent methyltransferase
MKLKIVAENPLEWLALKLNLAPTPLVDTQVAFTMARCIQAAAELGIFQALGKGSHSSADVAGSCGTDRRATEHLLNALVGNGYIRWRDGMYSITPRYHKWLLKEHESNLIGKLRLQNLEWEWVGQLEQYVRTGTPLDMHSMAAGEKWDRYQEGMRDLSVNVAGELARKIPVQKNAILMLDIGGSHGLVSLQICRRNPGMKSVILELPEALEAARSIGMRYDKDGLLRYEVGNVLKDDIGESRFDLVILNNVAHHFSADQNRELAKKVARALKPGGIFGVGESIRKEKPGEGGLIGAMAGIYFSLTSRSGSWSVKEIQDWQRQAGLSILTPIRCMTLPGFQLVMGRKG